MIEIHYGEGKTFTKIENLHEWESNPKSASDEALARLKYQVLKLGQHTPLLVLEDGTVLGGNQRLKIYKEIGLENVWVSIVYPKDDNEKMEFALSSNDHVGVYQEDKIQKAIDNYSIDWNMYSADFEEPETINEFITDDREELEAEKTPKQKKLKEILCPECGHAFTL